MRDTAIPREELTGYPDADWDVIDYQVFRLEGLPALVRGPRPSDLQPGKYVACIGAAQTFGRFCTLPFTQIVSNELNVPVLNLGMAGAGPRFFLMRPQILRYLNGARAVVVQVMSGRSVSNSVFECPNDGGTLRLRSEGENSKPMMALEAWRGWMKTANPPSIVALVEETRTMWLGQMVRLLAQLRPPKLLFWFSKRRPAYRERHDSAEGLFGAFPQLIDAAMIGALRPLVDDYVEVISERGSPQPLINRFTGEPFVVNPNWVQPTSNSYYPSPEMQQDAARGLMPALGRLGLERQGSNVAAR